MLWSTESTNYLKYFLLKSELREIHELGTTFPNRGRGGGRSNVSWFYIFHGVSRRLFTLKYSSWTRNFTKYVIWGYFHPQGRRGKGNELNLSSKLFHEVHVFLSSHVFFYFYFMYYSSFLSRLLHLYLYLFLVCHTRHSEENRVLGRNVKCF